MEATPQDKHCVRPCENRPKSRQKSLEENRPNGPNPGTYTNSQDARHIAHIGHDTEEAEMNQLSRFQHLQKMVKLIATHVDLGQNSDPICSDWSPDDDQDHVHIAGDAPSLHHHRNKGKQMIPYALRTKTVLLRDMVYFSALGSLSWTCSMLMIVLHSMYLLVFNH